MRLPMRPESFKMSAASANTAFVIVSESYAPAGDPPCRGCGEHGKIDCHPGEWPKCWGCGAKLLYLGRVPIAECVTPTGRIDYHFKRVDFTEAGLVCTFCKKGKST